MAPKLRKVKTASGATAVQIVVKQSGRVRVLEHLGSAHTPGELAVLMEAGRKKLNEGQGELDLGFDDKPSVGSAVVESSQSRLLVDVVQGLGTGSDSMS